MTKKDKINIASCLVESMETGSAVDALTRTFVADWICGGSEDKNQDMQDVWGIVLKNYYPEGRPVLFRATEHINDGKIESYTGSLGVAEIFLRQCGNDAKLLICDTDDSVVSEKITGKGEYRGTFFPLSKLLQNEMKHEDSLFAKTFMSRYIGEDEYIMQTEEGIVTICKVVG